MDVMIKKTFVIICLLAVASCVAIAYTIDDFEDGLIKSNPEWFSFGNISFQVVPTDNLRDGDSDNIGRRALSVRGATRDWYVGGIGVMLKTDAGRAKSFGAGIYGYGEGSGKVKFELYCGNNGLANDPWTKEIDIDWYGWKRVLVPINGNGSSGLVKLQLIFLSATQTGGVNCNLDNLTIEF